MRLLRVQVFIMTIMFLAIDISAQPVFNSIAIDSSIAYFKELEDDINWKYRDPVFGVVLDLSKENSIIWSVHNLKNYWEYETFNPQYYYLFDSCYVLLRIADKAMPTHMQNHWFKPVLGEKENIQEALYPKSVLVNRIAFIYVFQSTLDEPIVFQEKYEDVLPDSLDILNTIDN